MKIKLSAVCLSVISVCAQNAQATDQQEQIHVLAQRGNGIVTQSEFQAHIDKLPVRLQPIILRDGKKLKNIINALLINAQLAADARQVGFENEQIVVDRMKLAADSELAAAWIDHYVESQPPGNYSQLAHEYYQVNKDSMMTLPMIDVSHILISKEGRSFEEAKVLADSLSLQLEDDPSKFDQFIMDYSEDPSVSANKGKFEFVKKGDMVKAFEKAAFALQENEISSPVKTSYGYHIIRLDAQIAPTMKSFDEVKTLLIDQQRQQHNDRIKQDYLGTLSSLDVSLTQEALDEMLRRQFGEDYVDAQPGEDETE